MKIKALTVRIDEKTIERMDYYRENNSEKISQSDFVRRAIENECERIRNQRSGGLELNIPNPQVYEASKEQAEQQILILSKLSNELNNNCVSLDPGIDHIKAFFKDRLILNDDITKNYFRDTFYKDLQFESKLKNK